MEVSDIPVLASVCERCVGARVRKEKKYNEKPVRGEKYTPSKQ